MLPQLPRTLRMPPPRVLRVVAVALTAVLLAACGAPDEPAAPDDGVDEGTDDGSDVDDATGSDGTGDDGTGSDDQDTGEPGQDADEDGSDGGGETGEETDVGAMGFTDCEADRYTVGYPEGWNTNSDDGLLERCRIFHPGAIDVPEQPRDRDLHYAVSMFVDAVDFDDLDPRETRDEILELQEATVDGRAATVVEYRSTGETLTPEGERTTTWTIDLDGEILVATTSSVGETDYARDRRILERMITDELTIHDEVLGQAPPIDGPATTQRSVQEPDAEGPLRVSDVRVGHHGSFDRVTFEIDGDGDAGWLIEYDDDPRSQGRGDPVDIDGEAVLRVAVRGIAYPAAAGAPAYDGPARIQPERTEAVVEIVEDVLFEGYYDFFVGLDAERPYRVERLDDPQRLVLDIVLE